MKTGKKIFFPAILGFMVIIGGGGVVPVSAADEPKISEAEALSQFVSGNLAYKEGDYEKAIGSYETIIRQGMENGILYYNLGNSYLKYGSLGKAVLNYERARELIPRDSDLNFNYHYALRQAGQDAAEAQMSFWPRLIRRFTAWYTDSEMAAVIVAIILLIALVHLGSLYGKWPKAFKRTAQGILSLLLFFCILGFAAKVQIAHNAGVVLIQTQAKFEPRGDATTHFSLAPGAAIRVIKVQGEWVKIERHDGKIGWILQKVFEYI